MKFFWVFTLFCVLIGHPEWNIHRSRWRQSCGEGVKGQCQCQRAKWFPPAGRSIQVNVSNYLLWPPACLITWFLNVNLFCVCLSVRVLQHPNILQCLGQCVEAIPFLLVFEYCEMVSSCVFAIGLREREQITFSNNFTPLTHSEDKKSSAWMANTCCSF